ncbi:MAG: DUF927 domain-containing protein [Rubrivivax sp.]|nr:DUF927 domain-containing protein [Rubrivivax sp.]
MSAALAIVPPDVDRDTWVRLAMAVKAAGLPDAAAFDLWNGWSARGDSYSERDARDTWRSVKAAGSVTVATLFAIAKEHGFRFPAGGRAPRMQPAERTELEEARRRERTAEAAALAKRQAAGAKRAEAVWAKASETPPAMGAPYLERKGVRAHGLRFLPGGVALVPMRDAAGRLWSVQQLLAKKLRDARTGEPGTDKLYGPPKAGPGEPVSSRKVGLFHLIGQAEGAPVLLLAEGYATAASLHEATGRPVAVAFDAGNVVHVARELRQAHPALPLLVCGDDDRATEARTGKNTGREKAAAAVELASGGAGRARAAFPTFAAPGAGQDLPAGKDFNDLAAIAGADEVRRQVEAAVALLLAGTPAEAARAGPKRPAGAAIARADKVAGQAAAASRHAELLEHERAGGAGGGGGDDGSGQVDDGAGEADPFGGRRDPFTLDELGVWFHGRDREGNDKAPQWLCAPLAATARTRSDDATGWGYLLEFKDPDRNAKVWAMPASMLSGDGTEWAARLRDLGLRMAPGNGPRNLVAQYIDTRNPSERVTCTDRVGWHSSVYVLPSGCIGEAEGRRYVFQSEAGMENTFRRHGELEQWRQAVAAPAAGNSRLVFALSCAFAGPVLRLAGMESGGFHLRGTSSMGKTTALKVAASVWGRPSYMLRWRTTDNAIEATAVQHCDGLLILDELGQLDPSKAGEVAYLLANESEKGRATRMGLARKRRTWRLLFLSSGEVGLAAHMAEAGKRVQAGMEVRMVDVPLDAGAGMGGLEVLHGHESPGAFADALTAAAARLYGTAGHAWLEWACAHHGELPEQLEGRVDELRAEFVPEAASEQCGAWARGSPWWPPPASWPARLASPAGQPARPPGPCASASTPGWRRAGTWTTARRSPWLPRCARASRRTARRCSPGRTGRSTITRRPRRCAWASGAWSTRKAGH